MRPAARAGARLYALTRTLTVLPGVGAVHDLIGQGSMPVGVAIADEHGQPARRTSLEGHLGSPSVFRGIEGFGARRFIHTTRILSLADELPIMLVIVGDLEAIDDFVPEIAPLLRQGLITIEDVETVYLARSVDQLNVEHSVAQ